MSLFKSSNKDECVRVARRAQSLRIRDFAYALEGDVVTLEGVAMTPEAVDSVGKMFTATSVREVVNNVRHAEADPERPGALWSPDGYVAIKNLGPNAGRLAESLIWEVRQGDTVAAIAETVYGDAARTAPIVQANRCLTSAGDHLTIGERLRIPQ